jgi:hypothetical protein
MSIATGGSAFIPLPSVHYGSAVQIRAQRAATLDAAYTANPDRLTRRSQSPKLPAIAWINEIPGKVAQSA